MVTVLFGSVSSPRRMARLSTARQRVDQRIRDDRRAHDRIELLGLGRCQALRSGLRLLAREREEKRRHRRGKRFDRNRVDDDARSGARCPEQRLGAEQRRDLPSGFGLHDEPRTRASGDPAGRRGGSRHGGAGIGATTRAGRVAPSAAPRRNARFAATRRSARDANEPRHAGSRNTRRTG